MTQVLACSVYTRVFRGSDCGLMDGLVQKPGHDDSARLFAWSPCQVAPGWAWKLLDVYGSKER